MSDPPSTSDAPPPQPSSTTHLAKFLIQTSDVLQDARVNVLEQSTNKVIWYKERYLTDHEIVDHVIYNQTTQVCWTIHRPKRGWYIRIRAPSFPPGVFIPLTPVPTSSPHHSTAAMSFKSRTNIPAPMPQLSTTASNSSVHSYPPSPPPVIVSPPSPKSIQAELDRIAGDPPPPAGPTAKAKQRKHVPSTQISEFIIAPHIAEPSQAPAASSGFFARALQALKTHAPAVHSNSFVLSRVSAPPPYSPHQQESALGGPASLGLLGPPFLTFHDQTPVLTVRSLTGLLEIDRQEEQLLGIDTSFWITVSLTFLEFLEDRESYLAALTD